MITALPTAPLSSRLLRAVGGAVDNATLQGSTYLRGFPVQTIGATSHSFQLQPNCVNSMCCKALHDVFPD